jgi:transposase
MRAGKSLSVSSADIRRLKAVVQDRNAPQKHVWRAEIVLLTAEGVGTNEIMRRTAKSKTCVWRWQERFLENGFDGPLRDKTRPSRIKPLRAEATERVVALTLGDPPGETTHWTGALMAKAAGLSVSSVQRIWRADGLQPHRMRQCPKIRASSTNCATSLGSMSIRPHTPLSCRSTKRARFRRLTVHSPDCR